MGSALEDYGMSWMSSKIGGGGKIVVLTTTISIRLSMDGDLAPSFVIKGTRQRSRIFDGGGFCDESGRFCMRGMTNNGIGG